VTSVVARLPKGMVPLAMVLVVHRAVGSYAVAGLAVGLVAAGDAASAPVLGWLADRFGRGPVFIPSAAVHVAAVGAVLVLACSAVMAAGCIAGFVAAAVTAAVGLPGLAGVILAPLTAGGVIGTFGPPAAPGKPRHVRLASGFAAALLPAAVFSTRPSAGFLIAIGAALAVDGLFIAPIAATSYLLAEQAIAPGHRAEAFTWLSTSQAVGNAAAVSLASLAASGAGPAAAPWHSCPQPPRCSLSSPASCHRTPPQCPATITSPKGTGQLLTTRNHPELRATHAAHSAAAQVGDAPQRTGDTQCESVLSAQVVSEETRRACSPLPGTR
jgi:hypothetical protein